jgi:hypothetical protein
MSGSQNCLAVGTRLAEFEIQSVIGEGGFGIVYLAFDHSLQRTVAVKEYMPASLAARGDDHSVSVRSKRNGEAFEAGLRSFINEARLLAQFDHPALVKVYRFWEQNSTAYMAMRYYEGQTFKTLVRNEPAVVDEAWLRRILKSILEALDALYKTNILHRDISPENIMIQPGGDAVLLDFGAARQIVTGMSQSLTVILKPGYAPVEQYADDESMRQGAWTDIYSLSAVMYSAIAQKAPPAAVARMLKDPIVPLASDSRPGFSAQFLAAIDRGMSVRPEERPQTIAEFALLLGIELAEHSATQPGPARTLAPALAPAAPGMRTTARAAGRTPAAVASAVATPAASGVASSASQPAAASAPPDDIAGGPAASAAQFGVDVPPVGAGDAASGTAAVRPGASTRARSRRPALIGGLAGALALLVAAGLYAAGGDSPVRATQPVAPVAQASLAPPAADAAGTDTPTDSQPAAPAAAPAPVAPVAAEATAPQPARPAATTGTVTLNILPWANVTVDGVAKGPTPPLKKLSLPEGQHQIKIDNPNFAEHVVTITVAANKSATVKYDFSAHQ